MNLSELFNKKHLFAIRNVGEEKVLVPLRNNIANMTEIYTLNEVGSYIWDEIDGKNTEKDIVKAITEEFDIDETTAQNDLYEFLKRLEEVSY
jgi:methyltransferase-like protein